MPGKGDPTTGASYNRLCFEPTPRFISTNGFLCPHVRSRGRLMVFSRSDSSVWDRRDAQSFRVDNVIEVVLWPFRMFHKPGRDAYQGSPMSVTKLDKGSGNDPQSSGFCHGVYFKLLISPGACIYAYRHPIMKC